MHLISGDKTLPDELVQTKIRLFYTEQEGFGATYRRFMLARLFWRLVDDYGLKSVCEAPCGSYGAIGANSLPFVVKGCQVTFIQSEEALNQARELWRRSGILKQARFVASSLASIPLEDYACDLVWNFIAIPMLPNPEVYLHEMKRISKRFVLLVCPNRANYGYPFYVIKNLLAMKKGKFGSSKWFKRSSVRQALVSLGMKVVEEHLIDIPPWPGFEALLGLLRWLHRPTTSEVRGDHEDFEAISRVVQKYSFIEESRLPTIIKSRFAHLFYVLAERQ